MSKKGLTKLFDRSFSTRARYQIAWLVGIIVIAFLFVWGGFYSVGHVGSSTIEMADSTFSDDNSSIRYALSLMLDPGQIDHLTNEGNMHWWSLLFAFVGIITITGITISTITNIIQRRVNQYLNGEVRYRHFEDHKVIIGFDEVALAFIDQICKSDSFEKDPCDIIVMSDKDSKEIRQSINTVIDKKHEKYVYVYRGRKDSGEDLDSLLMEKANYVYLFGEHDEYNRDATNMEALRKIARIPKRLEERMEKLAEKKVNWNFFAYIRKKWTIRKLKSRLKGWKEREEKKIPVLVLFGYQSTYAVFQVTDLSSEWNKTIDFRPFNFYDNWAKKVLYDKTYRDIDRKYYFYPSIDGSIYSKWKKEEIEYKGYIGGINYVSEKCVHLVIFGMSNMGVALGVMAAHVCHFPNFNRDNKLKTRITFFSPNADEEMELFKSRYAHFFEIAPSFYRDFITGDGSEKLIPPTIFDNLSENLLDVDFEFIKGRAEQPKVRQLITQWANDDKQQLSIAVCLRTPEKNMEIGLYLPDVIYEEKIPVFIRQKSSGALLSLLNKEHGEKEYCKYGNVYPFGMLEDCYDLDNKDEKLAQWFHFFYHNEKVHVKVTESERVKMWQELDTARRWSNLYITYSVPFKLHSLGAKEKMDHVDQKVKHSYDLTGLTKGDDAKLKEENARLLARVEQNRWMVEKLLLGYRALDQKQREEIDAHPEKAEEFKNSYLHPDILPYNKLGDTAQRYNEAMSEIIPVILSKIEREKKEDEDSNT